jgi:F-type H+-transporting ATPase subunit a
MENLHIPPIAAEAIFHIGGMTITNTMLNAWIAIIIFLILGIMLQRRLSLKPGKLQNTCEYFLEILLGYFDQVTGAREKTMKFLPLAGTTFFFILLSNWLGLLPGTGSIFVGHASLLRPANTDLNLTVGMALLSVIISHLFGFITVGVVAHVNRFIALKTFFKSLTKGPVAIFTACIEIVVGLIEIMGEVAKVLSLSLRLFGNIFAGEVLLSVLGALVGMIIPTPFMFLEILVGLIQAAVFTLLILVYLTVATSAPHGSEEHH